jgi:cholesterol transport system auxiliary component
MMSCLRSTLRRAATLVALGALALTAGCSLTRPSVVKQTFLLDPANPPIAAKPQAGSLRVGAVSVGAAYRAKNFTIRESELKYESDFYNEFFVLPGAMIGDFTARALAIAKVFAQVGRPTAAIEADWLLDGFVGALYADMREPAKAAAVMQITYYLSRDNGGVGAPLWSKAYFRRVLFSTTGTEAYVSALNTALSEILAELARDLAAAELPPR